MAGDDWQEKAQHRERWAGMTDDFILKFDVEWASGKQSQLGNIQQSRTGAGQRQGTQTSHQAPRCHAGAARPHRRNAPVTQGRSQ